ncbi:hypothetical protein SCALM49S_01150 [Streptomyces californicus]
MTTEAVKALLETETSLRVRPRYEGSNINTWIGFKHVNYMVEEAVLEHFRASGLGSRLLFEEHGLGVDLVDLDTRILHAFHQDDEARALRGPAHQGRRRRARLRRHAVRRARRQGAEGRPPGAGAAGRGGVC